MTRTTPELWLAPLQTSALHQREDVNPLGGHLGYGDENPLVKQVASCFPGGYNKGVELNCLHFDDGRYLLPEGLG
ncbi:hypothetical protein AVEN_84958-1 [Araneus ventricosus]|uniref:Uncharacterized protein n=1 Tax=Araneus ventricosus TaxID=182803 RepID=A0A4Y2C0H4_ARAVE|nr:hypothetical protein AVEN_84958-1 [Araneus ventricosus]